MPRKWPWEAIPRSTPAVYVITHVPTGKQYVGCASLDVHQRWRHHVWTLRRGRHHSIRLQEDFDAGTLEDFRFQVLEWFEGNPLFTKKNAFRNPSDRHTEFVVYWRKIYEAEREWIRRLQPAYNNGHTLH